MVPKIIHYCWFGKKEKPQVVLDYIQTWHENNPDYEIKEWNEENFDYKKLKFTRQAYALKKYAFVSDVARLYALYTEGGIYLDTDIRVIKSFDCFLQYKSFIGKEAPCRLSTACIGSEAGLKWIKDLLDSYTLQSFVIRCFRLNNSANTHRFTNYLNNNFVALQGVVEIFEYDFFSAKVWPNGEIISSPNTVCIHEFAASWVKKNTLLDYIKIFLVGLII